jgi:hypothetical protein
MWNIIHNAVEAINIALDRAAMSAEDKAKAGDPAPATQAQIADYLVLLLTESRDEQLTGHPDKGALDKVIKIIDRYDKAVIEHCAKFHDLSVLTLVLTLSREIALLGGESASSSALDAIRACFAAEVRFRTTYTFDQGAWRFGVIVPVNLFPQAGLDAAQTASYTVLVDPPANWPFSDASCLYHVTGGDGQLSVIQARLKFPDPATPTPAATTPGPTPIVPLVKFTDVVVEFDFGNPLAYYSKISGPCSGNPPGLPIFAFAYEELNKSLKKGANYLWDGGFQVPDDGGPVLARRTVDQKPGPITSTSTIEIVHTPK